jgi:putative ABC transport system substrate-binding protein
MSICLRRREFIAGLGGAVAWTLAARAQQRPMPIVGYISGRTAGSDVSMLVAVRRGLGDVGYTEGRNVAIEYRFADGRYDRLTAHLTDLTQRKVGVIVLVGALTEGLFQQVRASPIPIVLITGADLVRLGLVPSMNRPGGNVTGVNTLVAELSGKQLGLLHDLVPKAATIAVLFDPRQTSAEAIILPDARDAAAALRQKLLVLEASTAEDIDAQFASLVREPADAMLVTVSPFFLIRAEQIVALAAHRIPAIYTRREFAEAGGLMSYGYNVADSYREMGRYAGRILNGEKPADLPTIQPTKFELVLNLKAAKAINFEIPPLIRALADEVIE